VKYSAPGGIVDFVNIDGEYSINTLAQSIIDIGFILGLVCVSNQSFR
jgi:hypothetical protein